MAMREQLKSMVFNLTSLVIGGIIGLLLAGFVNAREDRLTIRNKDWIVTLSVLGGLAAFCIFAFIIGEIRNRIPYEYNYLIDNLVQVVGAALLIFAPARRVKIFKNIAFGWPKSETADKEKKD